MKYILTVATLLVFGGLQAQHSLTKIWQTDTILPIPESVKFDAKNKLLYVSLIDGAGDQKDGKGGVAILNLDGSMRNASWITGLNAPKGIGVHKGLMYVADLSDVMVINIAERKIVKKIPVEGALFLNDITIDKKGTVYVSDSRKNKVHRIKDGNVSLFIDDINNANGLLSVGNDLYVLSAGELLKFNTRNVEKRDVKNAVKVAGGMEKSTDGIEMVAPNEFIVSCWIGVVYYVKNGSVQQMLDTRNEKSNTADIGFDPKNKIVYVPTFLKKSVAAYQLK